MTALFYALAALWAAGTFGACLFTLMDDVFSGAAKAVGSAILLPVWVLFGLGPLAVIQHESGPELTTLLKSEWHCAASHSETSTTYMMVGKVLVPSVHTTNVCDLYARN